MDLKRTELNMIGYKAEKVKKSKDASFIINSLKRDVNLYLMLLPFIIWFIIFAYKPLYSLVIAFQDYSIYKGISGSKWVGFEHFRVFFANPYFFRTLKNTLLISLFGLVFGFPAPIILALMFNELKSVRYKKIIQTITYMPYFISSVIIVGIVSSFLAPNRGLLNLIIESFGGTKIYFLTKPQFFKTIFTTMNIWKDTGFGAVVYIAALSGIDMQLYEAAKIDGASKLKQLIHVTLPGILPTIVIMFILKVGALMEVGHESILLLYQPATYETADVISTYVYRLGVAGGQQGLAAAVGLFNSVVSLLLVLTTNFISRKLSEISLW